MARDRYKMHIEVGDGDDAPKNEEIAAAPHTDKEKFYDLTPRSAIANEEKKKSFEDTRQLYALAKSRSPRNELAVFIDKLVNGCKLIEKLQRFLIYPGRFVEQQDYDELSAIQDNFSSKDIETILGGKGLPKLPHEHKPLVGKFLPTLRIENLERLRKDLAPWLEPKSAAKLAPA